MIPSNASPLRITAAAGTKLAGAYSLGTVIIFPSKRRLTANLGVDSDAAPRAAGRYRRGRKASGLVFDIVDLERVTQAAR